MQQLILLLLSMHAQYVVSSVCVCVCMCVYVCVYLTSGVSVHPENIVMYSAGNGGQKGCGFPLKLLRCRDPALPPLKSYTCICTVSHFPAESAHAHYIIYHDGRVCLHVENGFCILYISSFCYCSTTIIVYIQCTYIYTHVYPSCMHEGYSNSDVCLLLMMASLGRGCSHYSPVLPSKLLFEQTHIYTTFSNGWNRLSSLWALL